MKIISSSFVQVTAFVMLVAPFLTAAKPNPEACDGRFQPRTAFVTEVLAANGQYPQMNSAIRTRMLGFVLQNLNAPIAQMLHPISEEDIAAAAVTMDRIHVAMGIGALSYLTIDENIPPGLDLETMKTRVRGLAPEQAETYLRSVSERQKNSRRLSVVHYVPKHDLQSLLVSASINSLANLLETVRLFVPEFELGHYKYLLMTGRESEAVAALTRFFETHPDLPEKLGRFGQAMVTVFEDPELKKLATNYRRELHERTLMGAGVSSYDIRKVMWPRLIERLHMDFPEFSPDQLNRWILDTTLFRA